jgi:hypothetical protein
LPTPSYTAVSDGSDAISLRVNWARRISRCLLATWVRTRLICCCAATDCDSISLTSYRLC